MIAVDDITTRLRAAGCVFAEQEAELIAGTFTADSERERALRRRETGEPLEYVVGRAAFAEIVVALGPPVFVPRARAVALVDEADRRAPDLTDPQRRVVALDLGCGGGAIAALLRHRHPNWEVHASEVDHSAVEWARPNAESSGFVVHEGSWFEALPVDLAGRLDVVVAHLPYVPTAEIAGLPRDFRDHEPRRTVDGGVDGLDPLRAIAGQVGHWLRSDGCLLTQVAHHQGAAARTVARGHGLSVDAVEDDDSLVLVLRRPDAGPA